MSLQKMRAFGELAEVFQKLDDTLAYQADLVSSISSLASNHEQETQIPPKTEFQGMVRKSKMPSRSTCRSSSSSWGRHNGIDAPHCCAAERETD